MAEPIKKDNPVVRYISVREEDEPKVKEIFASIKRKNFIKKTRRFPVSGNTKVLFKVKIKRQEMLLLKLSITDIKIQKNLG